MFKRANKDAEVDALCLLLFWNNTNSEIKSRLIAIASDLVFLGRRLDDIATKFEMMKAEENSRSQAMAGSAWRKCSFLSEYADRVILEERFTDDKIPSERLMKAMKEDCTKIEEWNGDTLDRWIKQLPEFDR